MFGISDVGCMSSCMVGRFFFVDCNPCSSCLICPFAVCTLVGKCLFTRSAVNPGQVVRKFFLMALMNVVLAGEKHAAWRYTIRSCFDLSFLMMTLMDFGDDGIELSLDLCCGKGISQSLSPLVLLIPSNTTVPPVILISAS